MDLKQLRTFRAVAELGSLSKAADRLRAAQPALSRHIKLLEHELRVELFVRNGRGMLLTSAGRMLLDRTTGLMRQIEQRDFIAQQQGGADLRGGDGWYCHRLGILDEGHSGMNSSIVKQPSRRIKSCPACH